MRLIPLSIFLAARLCQAGAADLAPLMPHGEDYTQMWWAEGFPSHVTKAPWLRVIQTGRYAMALNTESLRIEHLGPVQSVSSYETAAQADDAAWHRLPAADLALTMKVNGKIYRGSKGGEWTRFKGPRLVESGRFFQRGDVTDLPFTADDGTKLNVAARFETAAWPDRLSLILAARPGTQPIKPGDLSFGRVRGGFGLDGGNHFHIPANDAETAGKFTLEFWVMLPVSYKAGPNAPWLVCKNDHELADGNYGLMIHDEGKMEARINLGGGRENMHAFKPEPRYALPLDQWNHLALSYDGDVFRLYLNGRFVVEEKIGQPRVPRAGALAIGRRLDAIGDRFRCRGVVDEIRLYDRALELKELQRRFNQPEQAHAELQPLHEWTFREDLPAAMKWLSETWLSASMELRLANKNGAHMARWELPAGTTWGSDEQQAAMVIDPVSFAEVPLRREVSVAATETTTGSARPVNYEPTLGWHRINLDNVQPTPPPGGKNPSNDAIERIDLVLTNTTDQEQLARLMFEKTARGFSQKIGTPITGISAMLCDVQGRPTGLPVQLSKNWHSHAEGGVYGEQWFHGISQVRVPPQTTQHLMLTLAYGHWGGLPAASHAQLSLIGWGTNQLWDQSALGSWGESICFEPDQIQAHCSITDVRPAMVRTKSGEQWNWTTNVGGGDWLRCFNTAGERVPHARMRPVYHKTGPGLTEVSYSGEIARTGIQHQTTVSLARRDDLVCGTYRIRMDVTKPVDFSRFVIFQIGADTYASARDRKMAIGNESGLIKEWPTQWGDDTYRAGPFECEGRVPWASLHENANATLEPDTGAWANRGLIIRSWNARLGGKEAAPWIAEHGVNARGNNSSTLDLLPPPSVTRFEAGDFIEVTIEHVIVPQSAADYYGPNQALRTALQADGNTWRMIQREAAGNDRQIQMKTGELQRTHPAITVKTTNNQAEFTLTGGLSQVPITFTGLTSAHAHTFSVDGVAFTQSIHGNDFWQTDYDALTKTWSLTFNVPTSDGKPHAITLSDAVAPAKATR